jgi:hypothetical protein
MGKGKFAQWSSPEGLARIEEWAAAKTDEELIAAMGVAPSTFYRWRKDHAEFEDAITAGRTGALGQENIRQVEASLLERCLGGTQTVMKAVKLKKVIYDAQGRRIQEEEHYELAAETVYIPADTNAIKFFLTNRAPETWKNSTVLSADPETRESVEGFLRSLAEADGGGREF